MTLKREDVANYFKEHGCELLGEYTGAMNKVQYRCSCGQISEISWNNFTKGKRCGCKKRKKKPSVPVVKNRLKRTTKEVADYFKEQGCELLGEYTGVMNKMKYRCLCGQISEISWNNFTKGKRCGCGSKIRQRYSIDTIREILTKEGFVLVSKTRSSYDQPIEYLCKCGKHISKTWHKIMHDGKHCHVCAHKIVGQKRRNPNWPFQKRLKKKMYKALRTCLKAMGKTKAGHTADLLGYGPKDLEARVTRHPNWASVKDGIWHLDHIFPIQAFIEHGITDFKLINCLENLRPMDAVENDCKHAKYDVSDFKLWLSIKGLI